MARNIVFLIGAWLLLSSTAPAQPGAKKADASEVEITFANGSVVKMTLVADKIDIVTAFGKLNVPPRSVRRIEFGLHLPDGAAAKIETAIKHLGSTDFKERENAVRDLVAQGAYAFPAVLAATKSTEPETAKRAQETLAKIRAKVPARELKLGEDDKVVTPQFTIVGRIVTTTIKAKAEYFGEVELSLAKLRHLRSLVESASEVSIDAARYAIGGNLWLDTGVTVDGVTPVSIVASGQVELRPQAPGVIVCGPKGYVRATKAGFGKGGGPGGAGGAFPPGAGGVVIEGPSRIYQGTLLGRIGENGDPFVIGEHFEGVTEGDGKLYLSISPSNYESATGSYQVKITTR